MTTITTNPAEALRASLARREEVQGSVGADAESRFLTLLTAQLKNQDPLNPLDNAQMTSQLAQISTVNGIEKLNVTMQKLMANMRDTETMQAAALVNRGVLVPGAVLTLGEAGALGGFELANGVDALTVAIKDANGQVVRTLNLGAQDAGVHPFAWDGQTDAGGQAALGDYSFSLTARRGGAAANATALAYGQVQAIIRGKDGSRLDLGAAGEFDLSDVRQIF